MKWNEMKWNEMKDILPFLTLQESQLSIRSYHLVKKCITYTIFPVTLFATWFIEWTIIFPN